MKKWIALVAVLLALLLGYVVAGPYLAIRGIHQSLQSRDLGQLERYVDFPALRLSMQAQVEDRLARAAGDMGGSLLGGVARQVIGHIGKPAVDAMVSPAGIAVLLEGRALARRTTGQEPNANSDGTPAKVAPLSDAKTRFESPSRFTATTTSADGQNVVFVFERKALVWKLSDIRLP